MKRNNNYNQAVGFRGYSFCNAYRNVCKIVSFFLNSCGIVFQSYAVLQQKNK